MVLHHPNIIHANFLDPEAEIRFFLYVSPVFHKVNIWKIWNQFVDWDFSKYEQSERNPIKDIEIMLPDVFLGMLMLLLN